MSEETLIIMSNKKQKNKAIIITFLFAFTFVIPILITLIKMVGPITQNFLTYKLLIVAGVLISCIVIYLFFASTKMILKSDNVK